MDRTYINTIPCIILAGGKGTRLQSAVPDVPKPMAPVNGKPFLEILIDRLRKQGMNNLIVSVGYKKESIINYFDQPNTPSALRYVEELQPLGTGGAIQLAVESIPDSEYALILNGDTLFDIDLHEFIKRSYSQNATCTLALKRIVSGDRYGEVILHEEKIIGFNEKRLVENALINAGVYFIDLKKFKKLDFPLCFSFEKDFLEKLAGSSEICGLEMEGYFIDIGIPEDYEKAQREIR